MRPIACGSVLRRIAGKAACRALSDEMTKAVGPCQYAVGRAGGCEVLRKTLRVAAELWPGGAFVKLDF